MRKALTILFILLCLNSFAQDNYVAVWKSNAEIGVEDYQLQFSLNKIDWSIFATVLPKKEDTNTYEITLMPVNGYWRVASRMLLDSFYFTNPIKIDTTINVRVVIQSK